ncbi:hypothetical protein KO489_00385 [Reinekea forsetii]|nr:hypothetical protein [Reinekea forsetii]
MIGFGLFGWKLLPKLSLASYKTQALKTVVLSKNQQKRIVEPLVGGFSSADLLCECDGHCLYLYGNNPKQFLVCPLFFVSTGCFIVGIFYGTEIWNISTAIAAVLFGFMAWLPHRHGVLFDRDHQTAMLIRGWLRKPLVVPFSAIQFIDYVEDVINFSRDLIVLSTQVPGRRKRPIRVPLSTAFGGSHYSMSQVVGAVHCFMDQDNTRAMPLAVKNSIEWFRRHGLTMWHFNWRPLPKDDLATYQKPDSLYKADLIDPSDGKFMEYVLPEGRALMARETLLEEYLDAVWENLSLEQVDPDLLKRTQEQISQSDIDEGVNRRLDNDRYENIIIYEEFNGGEIEPENDESKKYFSFIAALGRTRDTQRFSERLEAIRLINSYKKQLLSEGKITEKQYNESFLFGVPKIE